MQSAIDVIKDTYDYETCKEIVNHGCKSGVCSQHIYYADTLRFFEQYAQEITDEVVCSFGTDYLKELFDNNDADLDAYLNDLTWTFIELVAMGVVDNKEEQELKDDETVGNYMKEEISNYGYTAEDLKLLQKHGYNPERSMNPNRYLNV